MRGWFIAGRSKFEHDGRSPILDREFFDKILGSHSGVTDAPCTYFAPELIAAYPEAKVILNYRDVEPWYQSIQSTVAPLFYLPTLVLVFSKTLYWQYQGFVTKGCRYNMGPGFERFGRTVYRDHFFTVKGAVSDPANLLIWKLGDGWEPLCKFLEKDVPDVSFPRGNSTEEYNHRMATEYDALIEAQRKRRILIRTALLIAQIAIVGGFAAAFRKYWRGRK